MTPTNNIGNCKGKSSYSGLSQLKSLNALAALRGSGASSSCLAIARTHRRNIILLFTHFLIPSFTIVTIGETPNSRYFNSQFIPPFCGQGILLCRLLCFYVFYVNESVYFCREIKIQ